MCLVTPERAYYGQFCFCCCPSFDNVKLYIKQRAGLGRAAPVKMLVCWTITRPARRPQPAAALLLSQSELLRCHWHSYFRLQWYYHDHHILWPHKRWKRTHFTPENCQSVRWVSFQERSAQGDKVEFWQVSDTRPGSTLAHMCLCYIRWCMFIWRLNSLEIDGKTRLPNV